MEPIADIITDLRNLAESAAILRERLEQFGAVGLEPERVEPIVECLLDAETSLFIAVETAGDRSGEEDEE